MLEKIELPGKNSIELANVIARGETGKPGSYRDGILNDYFGDEMAVPFGGRLGK